MDCEEIKVPEEFSDISPYNDEDFPKEIARLVNEEGFENVSNANNAAVLTQARKKHH